MATVSTALLKAVAEAASAYRTGSDVYVVAHEEYPFDREVFYSYDGSGDPKGEAETFLATKEDRSSWTLFGPYVTERELPASDWTALNYEVTVKMTSPDGEESEHKIADEVDAIFLTLPAIDKFVMPYYTGLYGVERALEIRQQYLEKPLLNHVWNTKNI